MAIVDLVSYVRLFNEHVKSNIYQRFSETVHRCMQTLSRTYSLLYISSTEVSLRLNTVASPLLAHSIITRSKNGSSPSPNATARLILPLNSESHDTLVQTHRCVRKIRLKITIIQRNKSATFNAIMTRFVLTIRRTMLACLVQARGLAAPHFATAWSQRETHVTIDTELLF
jgi:hypothetical protein